jgi:pilus assembly protein CpaB
MLRRSPRAALLWLGAALVAIVTAVSVASTLASLRRQDRAFGRVRQVVVAARDLSVGASLTDSDLDVRKERSSTSTPGALASRSEADGRVVVVPVLRGSPLTRRHLASRERDGRDGVVPAGRRAMRVVATDGLRPRPGDLVDVYATFDPSKIGPDVEPTLTVAAAVPVVAVDDAGRSEASTGGSAAHVAVTVLVRPEQAKRLAFATANGVVTLAVAPPEEAGPATLPIP